MARYVAMELNKNAKVCGGSAEALRKAIAGGADLRISTGFIHNEHIDPGSDNAGFILETSTFPETVLIDGKWAAGFMTLRQPVELRHGFGGQNAMSLFLYNEDGMQSMGRIEMDGSTFTETLEDDQAYPMEGKKVTTFSVYDTGTHGGARNFIWYFEPFRFIVDDGWEELYAADADGTCTFGDILALEEAYGLGRPIKMAVKGISEVLFGKSAHTDEIFIHGSSSYDYQDEHLMISNSAPFVAVPADIPLTFRERQYHYCWFIARSDGHIEIRAYDPVLCTWKTVEAHLPVRFFAAR
ncbi:MAG: hypothetical protein IJL72_00185 [Lachnospiraceae bacterium]|nr:hypothetical protein [Lachnospiraceae bacterium]